MGKRVSEFLPIGNVKISVPKNRICRMENFIRKKKKKIFLKTEKNH